MNSKDSNVVNLSKAANDVAAARDEAQHWLAITKLTMRSAVIARMSPADMPGGADARIADLAWRLGYLSRGLEMTNEILAAMIPISAAPTPKAEG